MRKKSTLRDYFEAAIIAVILSLFVRTFLFEAFQIPTPSMETSLMVGDHVIVDKFSLGPRLDFEGGILPIRKVKRLDVVVFKFEREPEKYYVKRVMGLPGDVIKVEDKRLLINGKPLDEPYIQHVDKTIIPDRDFLPAVKVPPGHFFVMGDNRDNSADSREWGFVSRDQIKGRALYVYWSLRPSGTQEGGASAASSGMTGFLAQTRWDRIFHPIR
ncbi:MAG: signal peptidase I [Acidobacteriota bacterium]